MDCIFDVQVGAPFIGCGSQISKCQQLSALVHCIKILGLLNAGVVDTICNGWLAFYSRTDPARKAKFLAPLREALEAAGPRRCGSVKCGKVTSLIVLLNSPVRNLFS